MPLVIGLTGGIGSGKSSVASLFQRKGVPVIDADAIAHAVVEPGEPGWTALREAWGPGFFGPDGRLDRARVRQEVFRDPAARRRLEKLLHPLIRERIEREQAAWNAPYGILMIPLLVESGRWRERVDRLLVVDCPEDEQVRRVGQRSGLAADEVRAIMATQASRAARLAAADDVIDNSGAPEALAAQVDALDRRYRALAREVQHGDRA